MSDYYVTDSAGGGGSGAIGSPYTLAESTAAVAAGDTVWVKAGTYTAQDAASGAVLAITTAGLATTAVGWIQYIGYTTTINDFSIGDTPVAVLDASTNTLTNCVNTTVAPAYKFTGFRFTGASSEGVLIGGSFDRLDLIGCRIDNNGTRGVYGDDYISLIACEVDNNGSEGLRADSYTKAMGCKFHNNGTYDINMGSGSSDIYGNVFYSGQNDAQVRCSSSGVSLIGNTFDGGGQASSVGYMNTGSSNVPSVIANNIFFNLNKGVEVESRDFLRCYNLFYLATTHYNIKTAGAYTAGVGDVTGTSNPFTNSATFDYTLVSGSEAIAKGLDAGVL